MTVAAIIPTIPERIDMLGVALRSVAQQSHPVDEVAVEPDLHRQGPGVMRNRGASRTSADWLAFLDDDDIWHPHHIKTLLGHAHLADVIYSDCDLVGAHNGLTVNEDFDPESLRDFNYIPVTAMVRRDAFDAAGGFDPNDKLEDWGLWLRLLALGATFHHVPVVTWEYRFHGEQRTFEVNA